MEEISTKVERTRTGLKAQSEIDLGSHRILRITTNRPTGYGPLLSRASVSNVTGHGTLTHVMCYGFGKGDYEHTIAQRQLMRVTEKAVRELHASVLANLDEEKVRIEQHYQAQQGAGNQPANQHTQTALA